MGDETEQNGASVEKTSAPSESRETRAHPVLRWCAKFAVVCLLLLAVVWLAGFALGRWTGTVHGYHTQSAPVPVRQQDVHLFFDLTGADPSGARILHQETADALLEMIRSAGDVIVLDMFLVDSNPPAALPPARNTMAELVSALVKKKAESPNTWILFITDPINTAYRQDQCPAILRPLVEAGGRVVLTDLDQVGDSNFLYSPLYRAVAPVAERIPYLSQHTFKATVNGADRSVTPVQVLRLLNFKANHRRTAVVKDRKGQWHALVSSANPDTVGAVSENVAVQLDNGPIHALFQGELDIARSSLLRRPEGCFGARDATEVLREIETRMGKKPTPATRAIENGAIAQLCTEGAIGEKLDWMLDGAGAGDHVDILMFHLADPGVLRRIRAVAARGAKVRLLLDPNRHALGHGRHGIPNRVSGAVLQGWAERHALDLRVRWFLTQDEQAHFKLIHISNPEVGREMLLCGSANFTRRDLRDGDLEADIFLENARQIGEKCSEVFTKVWENTDDMVYSCDFDRFALRGPRGWLSRASLAWGNLTGACTY